MTVAERIQVFSVKGQTNMTTPNKAESQRHYSTYSTSYSSTVQCSHYCALLYQYCIQCQLPRKRVAFVEILDILRTNHCVNRPGELSNPLSCRTKSHSIIEALEKVTYGVKQVSSPYGSGRMQEGIVSPRFITIPVIVRETRMSDRYLTIISSMCSRTQQ